MTDTAVEARAHANRPASSATADIATTLILILIVAVAAGVRLAGIGDDSLWRDEAASWLQAQGSVADIIAATARDNYPPLHNLLLAGSMALFGEAEWALRLPSAIMGTLNVVAIYWVAAMIGGRRAGLIAALLLALSAFHIWYSQEARMYALLSLTATLFAGTAIALARRSTWPRTLAAGLAGIALLYSHPYGAFVWVTVGVAVGVRIWMRPQPEGVTPVRWAALIAVTLVAFLPWVWVLLQRAAIIRQAGFWIPFPTIPVIQLELGRFGSGALPLGFVMLAAMAALVRERAAGPSLPAAAGRAPYLVVRASPDAWVVVAWLLGPILIGLGISLVSNPIFLARYLIGSLPALFVLAGIGLARFATDRLAFVAVAALAAGVSFLGIAYSNQTPREDWRSVAAWIATNFRAADGCLVVANSGPVRIIEYYRRLPLPCVLYGSASVPYEASDVASGQALAVLVSRSDAPIAPFDEAGWMRGEEVTFGVIRLVPLTRPAP